MLGSEAENSTSEMEVDTKIELKKEKKVNEPVLEKVENIGEKEENIEEKEIVSEEMDKSKESNSSEESVSDKNEILIEKKNSQSPIKPLHEKTNDELLLEMDLNAVEEKDEELKALLSQEVELREMIEKKIEEIKNLEIKGFTAIAEEKKTEEANENILEEFTAPEWCIPIKANVMNFEWDKLAEACQFDAILMDPPWQLATHQPTRGVAIAYQQLPDVCIEELPLQKLQKNGFIFIWVINNKYVKAFELMEKWGYKFVDDITWVKQTVNRRMAKGHGYYLQHAKETCLVGKKGDDPVGCRHQIRSDVIHSVRRGQSQKPEELYEMIEELIPNGKYLEIFGRKNNLRDYWVTIGNEL